MDELDFSELFKREIVKCPDCGSENLIARALLTVIGVVNPNTDEILSNPDRDNMEYEITDFLCRDCRCEWEPK